MYRFTCPIVRFWLFCCLGGDCDGLHPFLINVYGFIFTLFGIIVETPGSLVDCGKLRRKGVGSGWWCRWGGYVFFSMLVRIVCWKFLAMCWGWLVHV